MTKTNNYLIIDWGTTNFRAFLMNDKDSLIDSTQQNKGLLSVQDNQFAETLHSILSDWLNEFEHLPIYMAGMVGSLNGWVSLDYVETPAAPALIQQLSYQFITDWGAAACIFPGVKHVKDRTQADVMRGEELQVFGLAKLKLASNFIAILPGTHSKHISFEQDKIKSVKTFMTGELFSIITQHSLLGKNLPKQKASDAVFRQGVEQSQSGQLTNLLFLARTHLLFDNIADMHIEEFISGLLIGYELKGLTQSQITIVGGKGLCQRYLLACNLLGIAADYANGDDCFMAGMVQLINLKSGQ
ncbi:2-dehydro-3-deoxygalactonokinase [Catenovulum maritimum]|uniref:2-dehydro-3-deoxygalactonokinase n=1 Tax=Catenovulum maritimum TaxID=1513271 RepID=A0A0J8H1B5_9ALTE|nr:2-dehydro-3-deoxygalactonokinase [Catenovulum maritimum]KMT66813.1 hypothetical protein XM47_01470 [Catenovulum maritimum]